MLPIGCIAFLFLFFSGDDTTQQITDIRIYQSKDKLQNYLEKLYDITDEQPFYFSNKADSLLQTLWRQPATKQEQTAYLDFILNIAYHLLQQGQIQASSRWYEKGLNFQQQQKVEYETEEFIVKPLGNNYARLGDYDKAIALQQAAIDKAIKENKSTILSSLYSNLAISYFWLGNYAAAQSACNIGLNVVSFQPSAAGLLYNVKADAFFAAQQYDSAAIYNQKAIQFFRSPDGAEADVSWIVSALQLSSELLSVKKQWNPALQKLQNAEKLLNESFPDSRQRDKAKLKVKKGKLFLQLLQTDSSRQNFKDGLHFFSIDKTGFFPDNTVTDLYSGLAKAMETTMPDSSLYYHRLAVANDYYCSQLITSSVNSMQTLTDENTATNAILFFTEQYRKTKQQPLLEELLWVIELSKGRKLLNEQYRSRQWQSDSILQQQQQLFEELRNDYLLLAESNDAAKKQQISERIRTQELNLGLKENRFAQLLQQPSFTAFQQRLKEVTEKNQFTSYMLVKDSLLVMNVINNTIQLRVLPTLYLQEETNSFIQNYFTNSSTAYSNNPAAYFNTSNNIYRQLIATTEKPLIISADGWLHKLPFEALSTDGKQQFLAEKIPVSYVYSFLQYVQEENQSTKKLPVTIYTFSKQLQGFAALPNSVTEEKMIRKKYKTIVHEAAETNADDFVRSLQSNAILHMASHAVAEENMQQPFLVLKQKFYLGQLQYIVTASPLVVLTACETAAGQLQQSEGVASIGRAFISKGVKAVIASRWKVDDAASPLLVETFYQSLKKQRSPVIALYDARKQYLQHAGSIAQKNPLLWSGFSYIGIDQHLQLQTKSFQWYWWWLVLMIPVVTIIKKKGF